jgi:hypothetical protein
MAGIYAKAPTGTGDSDAWIDGQLHFATAGASTEGIKSRMVIDKEGKVGIGITNPGQKLTVDGNIEMTSGSSRRIFMGGYGGGTFGLAYDLANSDYGIFYTEGTPVDVVNISPNGNSTAGAMTIYGNSRVGIGTTSANAGLTVSSGDIRATAAAFGNDANSISMSWEGSNGGYITARGPSTSQKGTIGLSVNQSNGGGGTIGLQIDSSGRATTPSNPAFRARATSAQSLANGWAQVGYDTLIQSRGTGYNTTTSRFTAPVAGWYQFNAQWSAANSGDADGTMSFWINGSATDLVGSVSMPDTGGTYDGHSISGCCYLAVGDFVQVHRYSTVATTTRTSVYYGGWFSGFLIG